LSLTYDLDYQSPAYMVTTYAQQAKYHSQRSGGSKAEKTDGRTDATNHFILYQLTRSVIIPYIISSQTLYRYSNG